MTWPFTLPTWLPWWVPIAVLVPGTLYALLFLLMPFSVFGLKGRIDTLEARLDEIQGEIRALILRLPERGGLGMGDARPDAAPRLARPPIPPRPSMPDATARTVIGAGQMMSDQAPPSDIRPVMERPVMERPVMEPPRARDTARDGRGGRTEPRLG